QVTEEPVPKLRGVAEAEAVDRFGRDAAPREVRGRGLPVVRRSERLAEVEERVPDDLPQPVLAFALLGRPAGELDAGALGKDPERFGAVEVVKLFEEREDVAAFSAAETLVVPAFWIDLERRRLLDVERADALV